MRTTYRVNPKTGRCEEVTGPAAPEVSNIQALVRPGVSIASSVLPRWDKDHVAAGGKCTPEGKPIIESRHQAQELCRRSQGERDVYWEYGDIDRL